MVLAWWERVGHDAGRAQVAAGEYRDTVRAWLDAAGILYVDADVSTVAVHTLTDEEPEPADTTLAAVLLQVDVDLNAERRAVFEGAVRPFVRDADVSPLAALAFVEHVAALFVAASHTEPVNPDLRDVPACAALVRRALPTDEERAALVAWFEAWDAAAPWSARPPSLPVSVAAWMRRVAGRS